MQAWDSVIVVKEDSPYVGTAGFVTRVNRTVDPVQVTAKMDKDGAEVAFVESDLKRLG
jgi:hypothetical protein